MGLRIIYGKPGSGKSQFCFSEIAQLLKTEKKIYMITPEQFSFTAEKKLMDAINKKAVINAEVLTLSRMAYRVLNETEGASKTHLSKCGKAMLIYSILSHNKKEFKFLGKSDENIELSMRTITEFKKHKVTVENLAEAIENIDDNYLKAKLADILTIYSQFEDQIQGKYIEENDLLELLAENIDQTTIVKDAIIYLDEFAGFTSQEYEVIKKFIEQAKQVNITICTDNLQTNTNPDIDIFYSNKKTFAKIERLVQENDFEFEKPVVLEKSYRFKTEELQYLSQNIYNNKYHKYEKEPENLHLFLAKNPYSEIEYVAKEIVKLVRNKNLRYKDISIITQNIDNYSSLVRVIFEKYDIPVFIDEKRDLNQNIIIQYVLSILEILSKNFSADTVFNYLKIGFSDIGEDEIFKLENYCTKWGIKNSKWKYDFKYEIDNESQKQQVERFNEIRKIVIEPLLKLKSDIDSNKSAENITKKLYEFLQNQNFEEKIIAKIHKLEEEDLLDLANEYISSYKILLGILDEIVLVFGEDKISLDKYVQILKVGLKNSGLGKIPGTQDQVIMGDVERSRSHKVKAVFIIGINDGIFPSINNNEGFLNDEDRAILKTENIELANGTLENLYEENFNIYKAFTTAENYLYLSYVSSDREGKSVRPSILIYKVKKLFPKLVEESDVITKKYELVNNEVTYEELLENIAKLANNEEIPEMWFNVYEYYKGLWADKLQNDLKGLQYTNLPEKIKKVNIERLYGKTLNTSVSRLEQYRSCPFSYYLQYGLRLKEKPELKVQAFDTGTFMHETIDSFFKETRKQNIQLADLDEEKIQEIVSKIVEEKLKLSKNVIFTITAKYQVLVKRLKKIISKALKYIVQSLVFSDFITEGSEIEFKENGKYKPIILNLDDGTKVEITGKIDRIDTATSEDGKYLRIIDYKSSAKNIDLNEVYAGLQIQLLTYSDAICKEENVMPAGVFYFSLLEQMVQADKKISDAEIEKIIQKNFKMKGLILADVKVIKMNDKTLSSGASTIVPAAISSSGNIIEKWTSGVTKEEFKILQDYIDVTIKEISKEIMSGNIELKPYNKNGQTPCKYCNYKSICGFNTKQNGNKYNYIDKHTKDDIIRMMKSRL